MDNYLLTSDYKIIYIGNCKQMEHTIVKAKRKYPNSILLSENESYKWDSILLNSRIELIYVSEDLTNYWSFFNISGIKELERCGRYMKPYDIASWFDSRIIDTFKDIVFAVNAHLKAM